MESSSSSSVEEEEKSGEELVVLLGDLRKGQEELGEAVKELIALLKEDGSCGLRAQAAASFKLAPEVAEDAFDVDMSLDEDDLRIRLLREHVGDSSELHKILSDEDADLALLRSARKAVESDEEDGDEDPIFHTTPLGRDRLVPQGLRRIEEGSERISEGDSAKSSDTSSSSSPSSLATSDEVVERFDSSSEQDVSQAWADVPTVQG
mmetsp:Transcript_27831/g.64248  ORF Transcript_27831/g.64248 Transcript_27831/m.64248 type:complete len:207 (+) Transcript_27831:51-671(+)